MSAESFTNLVSHLARGIAVESLHVAKVIGSMQNSARLVQHPGVKERRDNHFQHGWVQRMRSFRRRTRSALSAAMCVGMFFSCGSDVSWGSIRNQLSPSYPTVPPDYTVLQAGRMAGQAQVGFPAYYVDRTRGYRVTSPEGRQYVVDNIKEPKCAFYGTYVNTDNNGAGMSGAGVTVNSSVYVGEVNFENCK